MSDCLEFEGETGNHDYFGRRQREGEKDSEGAAILCFKLIMAGVVGAVGLAILIA